MAYVFLFLFAFICFLCVISLSLFSRLSSLSLRSITFGDFIQQFPAKGTGNLHFRFKSEDPTNTKDRSAFVWTDIDSKNSASKLPLFDGCLVAKVLNLDHVATTKRVNKLRLKIKSEMMAKQTVSNASLDSPSAQHFSSNSSYEPYNYNSQGNL